VLSRVAASLGVTALELEASLFADLQGERRVAELPKSVSPAQLTTAVNLAIVSSLVRRAAHVRIAVWGNSRALVRHARLMGLICKISPQEIVDGVILDVSGPFALFRQTEVYGRALASLLPRMAWCNEFELTAACALGRGGHLSTLVVRTGDPIGAGPELSRHDSRLEERFDREFRRAAPDWDVIREPHPVESGGSLIFPDFELVHRNDKSRRWLLEIVGFWTPNYLRKKLAHLRIAGIDRLLLCVDQRRLCCEESLPEHALIIRYKTRIDPRAVLAIIDG
jgi:predicted nuclease of restriction endonuclease-like RecB superfamily